MVACDMIANMIANMIASMIVSMIANMIARNMVLDSEKFEFSLLGTRMQDKNFPSTFLSF